MANSLYNSARELFLNGDLDWSADTIKVALVSGYTPNIATHDFLDDVTGSGGGTIAATSSALGSKTSTGGVADATDITFTSVAAGPSCGHLVIFKDTGSAASSPLIAVIDSATNLPVTPNGGDINVAWDSGSNKIFRI